MNGKSLLIEMNDDICRLADEREEHFFSLWRIGQLHIGDEDVRVVCRDLMQRMKNSPETLPALVRFYLFVVICRK